MKASDISLSGPQSFLFKGPFGFGKTLAAASFALEGPVYLSYWDKKSPVELLTYFNAKRLGKELSERILDNITFDIYGSQNAGAYLSKLIELRQDCRYTAIINDSLTFMTSAAVHWSQNYGINPNKADKKLKDMIPDFDEYKVESNLVSQCIDVSRQIPAHVIWTAHPVARIQVEGSGGSMRVTKVNPLVSYGSKVASLVPGGFTEIYHFTQSAEWSVGGKSNKKYIVHTEAIGEEFAKSPLLGNFVKEFDITDKLFYQVWKELIDKSRGVEPSSQPAIPNPFDTANQPNKPKW